MSSLLKLFSLTKAVPRITFSIIFTVNTIKLDGECLHMAWGFDQNLKAAQPLEGRLCLTDLLHLMCFRSFVCTSVFVLKNIMFCGIDR